MLQVLLVLALAPTDIGTGTGWTPGYFTELSDGADSIGGWGAAPPAGIDPLCSIPRERWCVGDEEVYAKKNADGTRGGNVWGTSLYHTHSRKRTRAHVYNTALTSIPFYFLSIYTFVYFFVAIIITLALSARQCLDRIRFKRIYGEGQKPVLISGLMDQWNARQLWRE